MTKQTVTTYLMAIGYKKPNGNKIVSAHKQLYTHLNKIDPNGQWYQPKSPEQRGLLFRQVGNLIVFRTLEKPDEKLIVPQVQTTAFEQGQQIKFSVRLPIVHRIKLEPDNPKSKRKYVRIPKIKIKSHYINRLKHAGLNVNEIEYLTLHRDTIVFHKNNKDINVLCADFTITATIDDLDGFIHAYKYGVGRFKTYGCGLMIMMGDK